MANAQGSVTIGGAGSSTVALGNNAYASANLSMFQSLMATTATSSGTSVLGGNSNLFVANSVGDVGVFAGGSAGQSSVIVVGDSSNLSYIGGSANTTIVTGSGDADILAGSGNDTIALGTGTNQVILGSGSSVVTLTGASNFLQVGTGAASITLSGLGHDTVNGGYGSAALTVDDSQGTSDTINVAGPTLILVSQSSTTTVNGFGNSTVEGGSAGTTIYNQQAGAMEFIGTGGAITVNASNPAAGNDTFYGANGTDVVLTGSSYDNVFVANQSSIAGGGGSVVFNGASASGGNQFWAGSGNATLIGGSGTDTMVAGNGYSTITGGSGASNYFDLFSVNGASGAAHVTITDFTAASGNTITLFGYGASGVAAAVSSQTQLAAGNNNAYAGGSQGTLITLGDGSTIFLEKQTSFLTASQFHSTDPSPV